MALRSFVQQEPLELVSQGSCYTIFLGGTVIVSCF